MARGALWATALRGAALALALLLPSLPVVAENEGGTLELIRSAQEALAQGRPGEAQGRLEQAMQRAVASEDAGEVAAILILLGEVFERTSQYQDALGAYEGAMKTLATDDGQASEEAALALAAVGLLPKLYASPSARQVDPDLYHGELGALDRLLLEPSARRHLGFVATLNAGNLYLRQKQFGQARSYYERALEGLAPEDALGRAQVHGNLAWTAIEQGKWADAQSHLDLALGETQGGAAPLQLRRAMLAAAVGAREQGDLPRAVAGIEEAIALYRAAGDRRGEARALAHLGTAYLRQGALDAAIRQYEAALGANRDLRDDETEWHARGGLARARHRSGDLPGALAEYAAYLKLVERLGDGFSTDQGRVSFFQGQDELLDDYLRAAVSLSARTRDFSVAHGLAERIRERALTGLLAGRRGKPWVQPGTFPAERLFSGRLRWHGEGVSGAPANMAVQMAPGVDSGTAGNMAAQMAPGLWQGAPAERQSAPAVPTGSRSEPQPGDARTGALKPGDGVPPAPRQRVDPPAVTFLEYYVMSDQTLVLVREPNGRTSGAIIPAGADQIDEWVREYRGDLDLERGRGVVLRVAGEGDASAPRARAGDGADLGQRLYRELVAPVRARLPQNTAEPVVIVPHRSLWLLPFAALRSPEGLYLGDQHPLSYSPSEAVWREAAGTERPDFRALGAWVAGNPSIPQRIEGCGADETFALDALPGAEAEAAEVAAQMGDRAELFTGDQADGLRLAAWHGAFGILHLATHGVACPDDPLQSFIVLRGLEGQDVTLDLASGAVARVGDARRPVQLRGFGAPADAELPPISYPGLLTAWSVASDFALDGMDLVTLSGCQTGLGRALGQGTIGFTRAFLAAGARSLLVSLWRVDDEATRELMVAFYREYLSHGDKAVALQRAMQTTRRHYPQPRYWAAFTLVGAAE